MRAVVFRQATWHPPRLVVDGHLDQSGGRVRGPRGSRARRRRTLVAVVVLRDQPTRDGDQAVLVVALTGGEDRLPAQRSAARASLAAAEDQHVHPRVGVVGDGDGAAAGGGRRSDERRGGAAALADLTGLDAAAAVVGLPPGHRRPAAAYVVPVERVRRDDEHPSRLVHREAVRDRLALGQAHGPHHVARRHVADDTGDRDEPDPSGPVGQCALDPRPAGRLADVDVADHLEALTVLAALRDHQQVAGERGDHRAVLVVEVEVAAAREVAERERAGLSWRELVGGEGRERLRVEHPQRGAGG